MPRQNFVILTMVFHQEGKAWLGRCQELSTSTYGRTLKQVHDELLELVDLHLNALEGVGERERFFSEHGIKFFTDDIPQIAITPLPVEVIDQEEYFHYHRVPVGA